MSHQALRLKTDGRILGRIRQLMKDEAYEKVIQMSNGEYELDPEYYDLDTPIPEDTVVVPAIDPPKENPPNKKAVAAKAPKKVKKPKASTPLKEKAAPEPLDDISELLDDLGDYENSE